MMPTTAPEIGEGPLPSLRPIVRFLFRHRGLRVVGHAVRRLTRRHGWALIDDFDGDLKFHCHLGEHIGSQMYWRDSYSWDQLRVLERFLSQDGVFVDVGANQGEFALFAAKRLTRGTVFAFEPLSSMFFRLQRNVSANALENVRLEHIGLWSGQDSRPVYTADTSFSDGTQHEGLTTLFRTDERTEEQEIIQLTTLDEFAARRGLQRLDVMKIDVEGAELEVVRGGEKCIERFRPVLLIEVSRVCLKAAGSDERELLEFLHRWYRFELVPRSGRSRPIEIDDIGVYQNVLCLPR